MTEKTPYDTGFDARSRGKSLKDNPHPDGTKEHALWFEGWCDLDRHFIERDEAFAYTFGRRTLP